MQDFLYRFEPTMPREVAGQNVHLFEIKEDLFAYDASSGALNILDEVGHAVLKVVIETGPDVSDDFILGQLAEFPPENVKRALVELRGVMGKALFSPDPDLEQRGSADILSQGTKALCLNIAHDCNLACRYCFAGMGRFGGKPCLMTKDVARKSLDFLITSSGKRRFLDVDFFGGEPLLAFDVVKDAVLYARSLENKMGKSFRFTLTTNCILLTDDVISFVNRHNISLILSIDGRPGVHDAMRVSRDGRPSHSRVLERSLAAVRSNPDLDYFVRGTYTKHNLDFYKDVEYLYQAGFRRISLEPAVGEGNWAVDSSDLPLLKDSYSKLASFWADRMEEGDGFEFYHFNLGLSNGPCRERRLTGCGAGYEYLAVTPEGDIYVCHQLVGNPAYLLGHVDSGIEKPELQKELAHARVTNKEACRVCWARYLCGGGCHARAVETGGTVLVPDSAGCLLMRTRLEYALWAETARLLRRKSPS